MDVFALRERVVNDYKNYIESFVRIRDKRIDEFRSRAVCFRGALA